MCSGCQCCPNRPCFGRRRLTPLEVVSVYQVRKIYKVKIQKKKKIHLYLFFFLSLFIYYYYYYYFICCFVFFFYVFVVCVYSVCLLICWFFVFPFYALFLHSYVEIFMPSFVIIALYLKKHTPDIYILKKSFVSITGGIYDWLVHF